MGESSYNELIETLRQLALEVDNNLDKGYMISYYIYKLVDILEGGTEE